MSIEAILTTIGAIFTIGSVYGLIREQTKTLSSGHADLKAGLRELDTKIDKCVTKSDFPAYFAREKMGSRPHAGGEE